MKEITESEAFQRLSALCAGSEQCREDLAEKMRRWGVEYVAIQRVLDKLEAEGYVDAERYARAFIRDKYRFEKWGRRKIAQALQLKKIPASVYQLLLMSEIDEQEYQSVLQKLLLQKKRSIHAESDYELNGKLFRFALGRGFETDDIRACLDALGLPQDENMSEE